MRKWEQKDGRINETKKVEAGVRDESERQKMEAKVRRQKWRGE